MDKLPAVLLLKTFKRLFIAQKSDGRLFLVLFQSTKACDTIQRFSNQIIFIAVDNLQRWVLHLLCNITMIKKFSSLKPSNRYVHKLSLKLHSQARIN